MKPWSDFYPYVQTHVMGAPNPLIDQQLLLATREFCERTGAWAEWLDAVTLDGTTTQFEFEIASGQELVKVARATLDDEDIPVKDKRDLPQDWQATSPNVFEDCLYVLSDTEYVLLPVPTSGAVLRIEAVLMPTLSADRVADVLVAKHADSISEGAKARLLAMPKKPWSEPGAAPYHRDQFEAAVHKTANEASMRRRPSKTKRATL